MKMLQIIKSFIVSYKELYNMGSYNIMVIWGMWIKETAKLHSILFYGYQNMKWPTHGHNHLHFPQGKISIKNI